MKNESILILFPRRNIGTRVIQSLAQYYRLMIIVLSKDEKEYFDRKSKNLENVEIVVVMIQNSNDFIYPAVRCGQFLYLLRTRPEQVLLGSI